MYKGLFVVFATDQGGRTGDAAKCGDRAERDGVIDVGDGAVQDHVCVAGTGGGGEVQSSWVVRRPRGIGFVTALGGVAAFHVHSPSRFPADVLCLDLEEAVPPEEKSRARNVVREAIGPLQVMERTVYVRLHSIQSGATRDDLAAIVQPGLAGVVLAKAESAQAVRDVDVLLREQELANDVRPGTIELVVAIESARALLACEAISHASTRLAALTLGGEDFTFDMGVERTAAGDELSRTVAL